MNRPILALVLVALGLGAAETRALAQAAAETVLLNANSAATTVKAGSAMGSALNQATRQLSGRVSHAASSAASTRSQQGIATPSSTTETFTTPKTGAMITSIAGASRASCAQTAPAPSTDKTSAAPQNCTVNPPPQKYKSQLTVSFPD
jgi:hypothetical protein